MAEENTENQATEESSETTNETQSGETTAGDVPPEVKAALHKANKEAETLRLKLKKLEDRDKTEAQKLEERANAAEKKATDLEVKALRLEVASEKGLTPAQAKRLVGATREELVSDADELLASFKSAAETKQEQAAASLDLGTRGSAVTTKGDPAADFAKYLNGQLKQPAST